MYGVRENAAEFMHGKVPLCVEYSVHDSHNSKNPTIGRFN